MSSPSIQKSERVKKLDTWCHKNNANNFRTSTQAVNCDFISWINAEGLLGGSHL